MRTRLARIGFVGLAITSALDVAHRSITSWYIARAAAGKDYQTLGPTLDLLGYVWIALALATCVSVFVAGNLPPSVRGRASMNAAALLFLVRVGVYVARRLALSGHPPSYVPVLKVTFVATNIVEMGATVLIALTVYRIAKAVGSSAALPVALATAGPTLLIYAWGIANTLSNYALTRTESGGAILVWVEHANEAVFIGVMVWVAVMLGRVPVAEEDLAAPSTAIPPEWRTVATGITLYLAAILIRVATGLGAYETMANVGGSEGSFTALRSARDTVINLGVIGAIGAILMILGVGLMGRAPVPEIRFAISGTIVCMVFGLLLDAGSTILTANALSGSVSAAFTALDVLPALAGIGTGFGVMGARGLLSALGQMADALGMAVVARRARVAGTVVLIAGAVGAVLELAIRSLPAEVVIIGAIVAVPPLFFVAVQMLRVMLALVSAIQERTARAR